jgi:hypothetical protein
VFGILFEDSEIFKTTVECVLGEEINPANYVVTQKENRMGSSIYSQILFDVYGESDKIYTLDMQNGYTTDMIRNRLVYYACRAVGGQKVKNFDYGGLKMCCVTFIFEKHSHKSRCFLTQYNMGAEIEGKYEKYSNLLTVVELNLGRYEKTDNENLNILCEFLKIQSAKDLNNFCRNHGGSGFGKTLYDKYIQVITDTNRMESVANMHLYREKVQLKYLSDNDVQFIREEMAEEMLEKMAVELLDVLDIEIIAKKTNLTVDRVKELKEEYEENNL